LSKIVKTLKEKVEIMKFMRVCVRFSVFIRDSEDSENSNYFEFIRIRFEMFEFVWEGKNW